MAIVCLLITAMYWSVFILIRAEGTEMLKTSVGDMNCTVSVIPHTMPPMFSLNGEDMVHIVTVLNITSHKTYCELYLSNYLKQLSVDVVHSFHDVVLICYKPLTVHIKPLTSSVYRYIMTHVTFTGCTISLTDLDILTEMFDIKVLSAANTTFVARNGTSSQCQKMNIVSSTLYSIKTLNCQITDLFSCYGTHSNLAELYINFSNMTEIPMSFKQTFVHLQSLELINTKVSEVPTFSWANTTVTLPGNISRTKHMQEQYASAFGIDVARNHFRKILILDSCRITSLHNNVLTGKMHLISLKNNALERVDSDAFSMVRGLQRLHLQGNKLSEIAECTFAKLNELRGLYIGHNQLLLIEKDTFRGLNQLEILNVQFNKIVNIHPDAFRHLISLKEIKLSNNQIKHISEKLFSKTQLVKLDLSNNPLSHLSIEFFHIRSLTNIDLSYTFISFDDFDKFMGKLDSSILAFSSSGDVRDLFAPKDKVKLLDLSDSRVTSFNITLNSKLEKVVFSLILRNFKLILKNDPIKCYCDIMRVRDFLFNYQDPMMTNEISNPMMYYLNNWKCNTPENLYGRSLGAIDINELYFEESNLECISSCTCHQKCMLNITIIDCKNRSLTELPLNAPPGKLELWFQDNNITKLEFRDYFKRATKINLQNNALSFIDSSVYKLFLKEKPELRLAGNHLQYIPETFKTVDFRALFLSDNTFICDCHSLWMKWWIVSKKIQIKDWDRITCATLVKKSGLIQEIPDKSFICISSPSPYNVKVITSSIVISISFTVLVISVFVFRREISFLLFVYFNIRFAKPDSANDAECGIFLVYPEVLQERVQCELLPAIKELFVGSVILDIRVDLVAGLSFQDNVDLNVMKSKHMIFILTSHTNNDDLCSSALLAAQDKCKNGRPDYFILIIFDMKINSIKDKFLKSFIRVKRYIRFGEKRLKSRLDYFIVRDRNEEPQEDVPSVREAHKFDIFLSFSYSDVSFCLDLMGKLQEQSYKLCIPERDFSVGVPIDINIIEAVNSSNFTVICLSDKHNEDEWTAFIFQLARQKCLRNRNNKLIVILNDKMQLSVLDENMRQYVETHVCLKFEEEHLVEKLDKSLQAIERLALEQNQSNCDCNVISENVDDTRI